MSCGCSQTEGILCPWCSSQVRNTATRPRPDATEKEKQEDRRVVEAVKRRQEWREFYGVDR